MMKTFFTVQPFRCVFFSFFLILDWTTNFTPFTSLFHYAATKNTHIFFHESVEQTRNVLLASAYTVKINPARMLFLFHETRASALSEYMVTFQQDLQQKTKPSEK